MIIMSRVSSFLKNILSFICILLAVFFVFNELSFLNRHNFLSPLAKDVKLVIRNDIYGDGHFGARRKGRRKHIGIDLQASVGTSVHAVRSGWTVAAGETKGLGKHVELYHKNGLRTVYGHLDSIEVKMLERVRQGEIIGSVGKTGNAKYKKMKTHLHFVIIKDDDHQDPAQFLPNID